MLNKSFFLIIVFGFVLLMPVTVFSQSDVQPSFRAKSTITGEHFNGGVMWTILEGDKSTTIVQWDLGRTKIYSDTTPISDCESNYQICFMATVTDKIRSAAVKPGDQFIVKIDPENKKQVIVGKSGFLENIEIILQVDKIY